MIATVHFASATNDIDPNSHDRVDYVNDGSDDETRRWTNWSPTPSDNPEVSVGVIFREAGKIVERTALKEAFDSSQMVVQMHLLN